MNHRIFITGGSGYIGSRLIPVLKERGHEVTAVVRAGSETKVTHHCRVVVGNALEGRSYSADVDGCDTFIHLVGVPHPSPAKARQFVNVDQRSALEAIQVASAMRVRYFVYLSVAQPAPVMKAYVQVRQACERALIASGLSATIVRPWYVLGPGHRWPIVLRPFYVAAERVPRLREGAKRLGLVTIGEIVSCLAEVVDEPADAVRIVPVPEIREAALRSSTNPQRIASAPPHNTKAEAPHSHA
jgi:uncharacterized protein YbjT (DUF2867 family)